MEPRPPPPRRRHAHSRSHTAPRPLEPVVMTGSLGLAQPSTCWFVCHSKLCAFVKYWFLAMNKPRSWQKQWGCNRGCGAHLTAPMAGYFCFVLFLLYKFYDMLMLKLMPPICWLPPFLIHAHLASYCFTVSILRTWPNSTLELGCQPAGTPSSWKIGQSTNQSFEILLSSSWFVSSFLYPNFSGWRSASSWTRLVKTYRKPQTTNQFCR